MKSWVDSFGWIVVPDEGLRSGIEKIVMVIVSVSCRGWISFSGFNNGGQAGCQRRLFGVTLDLPKSYEQFINVWNK
jgi:hypothetical protein